MSTRTNNPSTLAFKRNELLERNATSYPLTTPICTLCSNNSYPSPDLTHCIQCPDPTMVVTWSNSTASYVCGCRTELGYSATSQGDECIPNSILSKAQAAFPYSPNTVTYNDLLGPSLTTLNPYQTQSDIFTTEFYRVLSKCQYEFDTPSCAFLANLCVLQLYNEDTPACAAYRQLAVGRVNSSAVNYDAPVGMPWLYHGLLNRQDATTIANQAVDLGSGGQPLSSLHFLMATYALNGTFLGWQNFTGQLQLCTESTPSPTTLPYLRIGHNYQSTCQINLASLPNVTDSMLFYDIYLQTPTTLHPIPLRITNFRSGGKKVNEPPYAFEYSGNRLFRRMFVWDNVSGKQGGIVNAVRALESVQIWIRKSPSLPTTLLTPIIDITYSERLTSGLSPSDTSGFSSPRFTFTVTYIMDLSNFYDVVKTIFAMVCVLGVLAGVYRGRAWGNRNGGMFGVGARGDGAVGLSSGGLSLAYLLRTLTITTGVIAPLFSAFLFILSIYWFFFYKNQSVAMVFLPSGEGDMTNFLAVLITALVCQGVYLGQKLYDQCMSPVFFMDWEKSRGRVVTPGGEGEGTAKEAPVSVWRRIFMANFWCELQTYRPHNVALSLVIMYVVLSGFRVRYAATPQPGMGDLTAGPINPLLLFAIEGLIWLLISIIQYISHLHLLSHIRPHPHTTFIDLLSLSNISLLVFDEPRHGYYVHGRSVHGVGDLDFEGLRGALKREEGGGVVGRG
ncbi:hypothetical protein HDV00_008254, partial [Rhizophlyctis rosea]